jgi:hypothetical protein
MRYDALYTSLARRAVETGLIDIRAFVEQATAKGASLDAIERQMLDDLMNDGPLFGKFFRNMSGAAEESAATAFGQGVQVGELIATDAELAAELAQYGADDLIEDADPEVLEEVESLGQTKLYMWHAELRNTCEQCLPLHGKVDTKEGWRERGLEPQLHPRCKCTFVLVTEESAAAHDLAPLVRNKDLTGVRAGRKTVRGVTQPDIDRARIAAQRASETPAGRKMLKLMGSVNGPGGFNAPEGRS